MAQPLSNILFLCIGNICRSPFAHRLFEKLTVDQGLLGFNARSAGLMALPGNAATLMAQQVAAEYGVDLAEHKAQAVSKELIDRSDLILVMEKSQEDMLIDDFPEASGRVRLMRRFARFGSHARSIADPYGLNYEAYRFCYLDIEDAVTGLVEFLASTTRKS